MSNKRSKRHHFVPIVLQKQFASQNGKIWYCERINSKGFSRPEERNHISAFKERNYNTTIENGVPSDRLEREFWGVVDNHLGDLLPQIEKILKLGNSPNFRGDSFESLINLFAATMTRSPDIIPDANPMKIGEEIYDGVMAAAPDIPKEISETISNPTRMMQNGRHVFAYARTVEPKKVLSALRNYSARLVMAEKGSAFILGSRLVYRIGNGNDTHLDRETTELWFPVSPSTSIVLVNLPKVGESIVVWPKRKVRQFNEFFCEQSSFVGSHSVKLLSSLIKTKKMSVDSC